MDGFALLEGLEESALCKVRALEEVGPHPLSTLAVPPSRVVVAQGAGDSSSSSSPLPQNHSTSSPSPNPDDDQWVWVCSSNRCVTPKAAYTCLP